MRSLLDLFPSSLSFSAWLSHHFNTFFFLLSNNFRTFHLAFLFGAHSYLQCTFFSCSILNSIFSISSWISLSYLSISYFRFSWRSSLRTQLWTSVAIFSLFTFNPPGFLPYFSHLVVYRRNQVQTLLDVVRMSSLPFPIVWKQISTLMQPSFPHVDSATSRSRIFNYLS